MTLTLQLRQDIFHNSDCFHIIRDSGVTQKLHSCLPVHPDPRKESRENILTYATNAVSCSTVVFLQGAPNQLLHPWPPCGSFSPCGFLCSSPCFPGAGPKELPPSGEAADSSPSPIPNPQSGAGGVNGLAILELCLEVCPDCSHSPCSACANTRGHFIW